jgi:hypothetical protein
VARAGTEQTNPNRSTPNMVAFFFTFHLLPEGSGHRFRIVRAEI